MPSQGKDRPEFSREREFKVLLEDIQSSFRTFGEGLQGIDGRLERVEGRLERVEGRLERVESDVAQIKTQMSFVYKVLPTVATKDDLRQLEKRIVSLETR